jgi:alkyl hydroperoxide reductase subunit AhpC
MAGSTMSLVKQSAKKKELISCSNFVLSKSCSMTSQAKVTGVNKRFFSINSATMSKAFITKPAPDFKVKGVTEGGEFKEYKLSDFKGKYLVLFFYPLDFTFVCPTEIIAFSDRVDEFKALNCELLACSVDSHFSHLAWTNVARNQGGIGEMRIPILSDLTKQMSRDYGVLLEDAGVALRGLFIIDDKGTLRQITINDLPVGRSVDETIRLVQAFQFTDKHGEVCPAGWKPGSDTMKASVNDSKEYFSKQ